MRNPVTGEESVIIQTSERDTEAMRDPVNNVDLELVESIHLSEWLVNNYRNYGATLEFITNKSQEGSQFHRGFGGIGGILRYKLDMSEYDLPVNDNDFDDFI